MGMCVSTIPIDYGELTPGNTTKHTPTPEIKNGVSCMKTASEPEVEEPNCSSSTIGKYRKFSDAHSQSHQIDTEYKYNAPDLSSDQPVEIDENIIIEDFIKIYDHKKEQYQHYGLLLNHKQCKLYLINPHYFEIWKKFETLTKMNDIISNKRHSGKSQGKNLIFSQKDAEEMVNNLVSNKANHTKHSFGEAINFIMRKNKYLIAKDIMLTNKWDATLSFILKIDEELIPTFVNHIIIKYYDDKHTHLIFKFLRLHGLVIKYHNVEKYKNETDNTLHIIFMNDLLLKTIQMLNDRIINYLLRETKLNKDRISKHITIQPYFDQVINDENQSQDIKVIDLQSTFVSVESINDFDNKEFDGFLYGFTIKREDNQHFTCLLDSNNRRFAWISHLQFILNNNEVIGRRYCSKSASKRLTMLHLDKDLFIVNHKCNNTDNCTYIQYLIAINKLYTNHSMDDVVEIILHRKISLVSIHDSYIHCIINPGHNRLMFDKFIAIDTKCNLSNCIHFKRFDADKNCTENRQRYYNQHIMPNCDIIHILDQIHCYLYHTDIGSYIKENNDGQNINNYNRRRLNSLKFIRNLSFSPRYKTKLLLEGDDNDNNDNNNDDDDDEKNEKKEENRQNVEYFSGRLIDYWSAAKRDYNEFESSEDLIAENFEDLCDGIVVFAKYDSLKQEVTQNIVCKLHEEDYNDIYQRSLILLNTTHCMKNMVALHDNKLNEKMCVAAGEYITINHIMSIIIYCNYFNVCREWLQFQRNIQQNNSFDDGEFAHFYRYLCEICQLFGQNMRNDEYLYIIPTNNILFKQWKQMIYFPMSVSPPQSFTKELLHNNNNNNYNILKLGTTDNYKCDTQFTHTRYFDVRWLSDSYNENERFIMQSPVRIYDILLGEKTSCLKDIYAMQLFQRLMNSQFFSCISSLNQIETQKNLSILIQNHMYNNLKQKCLEKNPLYIYILNIFDNLIDDLIINKKNNGSIIWFNKSELNKLKCKELAVSIYNIGKNKMGTLLNHYDFPDKRISFVQEYEFVLNENVLNVLIKNNKNKRINSDDEYFIYNSDDKISLYFEFSKKLVIANNNNNNDHEHDEVIQDFECYLCVNLILLPSKFDKVLIECNVYCEDLNQETQFEAVWASKNSAMYNNAIGGLVITKNMTKHLDGLPSLTFIITLKVLQTNAVRSPTKSILSNFK